MAAPLPALPHSLVLKVLRLQKSPLFISPHAKPYTEQANEDHGPPLSSYLALPTSFGTCNLGESFSALIVANNESEEAVSNASLRIEMHTASTKTVLAEVSSEEGLLPATSVQARVVYEVKEQGQHALACTVTYTPQGGDASSARSFRKTYKFVTSNPLSVKTKIHSSRSSLAHLSESSREVSYLEVQIQNTSKTPLSFSRIQFQPAPSLKSQNCNPDPDYLDFLYPNDVRQLLYICEPEDVSSEVYQQAKKHGVLGLGKLDIEWRGTMGEIGRLQTSTLVRKIAPSPVNPLSALPNLNLSVVQAPKLVNVGEPFDIRCKIRLSSTQNTQISGPLHLQIQHLPSIPVQNTVEELASALNTSASLARRSFDALPSLFGRRSIDSPVKQGSPLRSTTPNRSGSPAPPHSNPAQLLPSPSVYLVGPTYQSLQPIGLPQTSIEEAKRISMLSDESNEPLQHVIERAASRTHSRATSVIHDSEEQMHKDLKDEAEFSMTFIAEDVGLLNVAGFRVLLREAAGARVVAEQNVLAQVYSVNA